MFKWFFVILLIALLCVGGYYAFPLVVGLLKMVIGGIAIIIFVLGIFVGRISKR